MAVGGGDVGVRDADAVAGRGQRAAHIMLDGAAGFAAVEGSRHPAAATQCASCCSQSEVGFIFSIPLKARSPVSLQAVYGTFGH